MTIPVITARGEDLKYSWHNLEASRPGVTSVKNDDALNLI